MSRKSKKVITKVLEHLLIYVVLFITIFPILWMLLASFEPQQSIINQANHGLFEFVPTLRNYISVFTEYNFSKYKIGRAHV